MDVRFHGDVVSLYLQSLIWLHGAGESIWRYKDSDTF
jgi:hypothetical protein